LRIGCQASQKKANPSRGGGAKPRASKRWPGYRRETTMIAILFRRRYPVALQPRCGTNPLAFISARAVEAHDRSLGARLVSGVTACTLPVVSRYGRILIAGAVTTRPVTLRWIRRMGVEAPSEYLPLMRLVSRLRVYPADSHPSLIGEGLGVCARCSCSDMPGRAKYCATPVRRGSLGEQIGRNLNRRVRGSINAEGERFDE
jgi:hypothetical protein